MISIGEIEMHEKKNRIHTIFVYSENEEGENSYNKTLEKRAFSSPPFLENWLEVLFQV